MVSVSLGKQT